MSYKQLVDKEQIQNFDPGLFEKYLNAAMTSTLQDEFYSKKDEQTKVVALVHKEMLENNRELYGLSMLLSINDVHKMLVIKNLIETGKGLSEQKKDWENNLALDSLKRMGTARALRTLYMLALSKINNSRARWIARQYVKEQSENIFFLAMKYKRMMKAMFRHYHVMVSKLLKGVVGVEDVERFLFEKDLKKIKQKDLKNYVMARKDKTYVYDLPYSVAEGFRNLHGIDEKEFLEEMNKRKKLSAAERRRAQGRADRAGTKIDFDLSGDTPTNIQKFLRSDKAPGIDKEKASDAFEKSAKREAKKLFEYFEFDKVKIVLDNSASAYGSDEKKNHPVSVGEACAGVLKYLSGETEIIGTPNDAGFIVKPGGASNIYKALMKALKGLDLEKDNIVFIISDGYENEMQGMTHQLVYAFKKKIDKKEKTIIVHLNPVYAPESKDLKKLSEIIKTFGVRDTKQLFIVLLLSVLANKKDKKVRKMIEDIKKKVVVRKRSPKKRGRTKEGR